MKQIKRTIAVLLSLALLLCSVPFAALGADVMDSGVCGVSLTWLLDSNGTLVISGTGRMDDYGTTFDEIGNFFTSAPWGSHYASIRDVVLAEGVTSIGCDAFYGCSALQRVMLSNDVTTIGERAFAYCAVLRDVTIPSGLTTIEKAVFLHCAALESVTLPDSVTSVGNKAFTGCTALKDVYYTGSEADWTEVSIGMDNEPLATATMHYYHGHEHRAGTPARENEEPATCTKALRFDEVTNCSLCGTEMFRERKTDGDPLGHDGQTYSRDATCAASGYSITICRRCGEMLASEVFPAPEHTWNDGEATTEPTCDAQGTATYTCLSCGATKTEPIDKLDHTIVLVPGKAPTCEDAGLTDGWQCEKCKTWFAAQQSIDPLDHDYAPVYVWSDDCSTVTATLVCTRCDAQSTTETVTTDGRTTKKPTCAEEGERTYTALFNCKAFYPQTKTEVLEKLPHQPVLMREVSPTCTSEGVASHWRCSMCEGVFTDETATEQLDEAPKIERLPHTFYEVPAVDPTCTEDGVVGYWRCETCETYFADETGTPAMFPLPSIPATGHMDKNNDGKCDTCGERMTGGDHCPQCGKIHNGNILDRINGVFHRLVFRLTHLFG